MTPSRLLIAALAACIALPAQGALAACTVKQQQAKINQLNALMAQKSPARAHDLDAQMRQALLLEGDEICAGLGRAIAQAK